MTKALIVEGGGMKAAYANGVLTSFEQAGYYPWDIVLGTSAGGALAAWYSAKQAEYAEQTWPYAGDSRILNYRRWVARKGPLLDHEALLDIVYVDEHPIDLKALQNAPWPVIVNAVDIATGEALYQDLRSSDAIAWLKATGRLPLWCGEPVPIGGRQLVDGGVVDPIPVDHALEHLGATDVTLITNKPAGPKRPDPKFMVELAAKKYPPLREGLANHQQIKWTAVQKVLNPPAGVQARLIAPSRPTRLTRLDRNLGHIGDAIALGRADGHRFLQQQDI